MNLTITYCPPNITFAEIWVNHGLSKCFMDTVSSSIIFLYLIIFGSFQLWMYKKYGTPISNDLLSKSKLYALQRFLLYFVPVLSIWRMLLQATVLDDKRVYGYMILSTILTISVYPYSAHILSVERHKLLPSVPPRGHGIVLLGFWTLAFVNENLVFINIGKLEWWFHLNSRTDQIEMALFVLRYVSSLLIFVIGLRAPGISSYPNSGYTSFHNGPSSRSRYYQGRMDDNASTWQNAWYKIKTLAPFLWPKSLLLQFRVLICFGLLIGGRAINLFVPIYNKNIVDSVTDFPNDFRWDLVLIYVAFKFLQGGGTGGMGVLNNLRSFLWIRIQQYTTREIEIELFRHLHSLSLRWHLQRKTGEVLKVMDRGTDSINNLLNYILFSIVPTIVDIIIAIVFFVSAFNKWFGLIVFITMSLYIAATILVTEWRTKYQRRMNLAANAQNARSVDSLLNFETVKYYGAEIYEVESYRKAILDFQVEEWKSAITLNILNTLQNVIICSGLLAGSLLCLHMVVNKENNFTIGDYVLFASYIVQLYVPLNWFGTYYRAIQKNFVDMENMFDLLREDQEVIDAPGAGPLQIKRGQVEFSNVTFGYTPERTVLKNISFIAPAGKTIAFVGPSGAGKSTIMRLLFRFYDIEQGAIIIDDQNIKTVQQQTLRNSIGVVPQDTVLFNNTIKYNIQYGRIDAPEADVITAAKSADIHEKILTFPNGYETQVGERGLRLSGGEKQRVAIARTILKAPNIVLLDEATSALDTKTERNIQAALNRVCIDRTTIIIAHRLSTIIHADEIYVVKDGEIVERGKHEELIAFGGAYSEMWKAQLQNDVVIQPEINALEESSKSQE
ncbi:ATP-binding cassette sub-family B member 6 [Prorops nasuta]|uniref:ATP-binding cassette sub-family B member 6 n=1 Tax=Prorops nasuta TaxID=863751 RepID=UPI0034CF0A44